MSGLASPPASRLHTALTADGALALTVERALADMIAPWLPTHLRLTSPAPAITPAARITVRAGVAPGAFPPAASPPTALPPRPDLVAGRVRLWRDGERMLLNTVDETSATGIVDLAHRQATITVAHDRSRASQSAVLHPMLLLASAYLLGRLGRALVHGAALVAPDGRAWLLVGDTHAGKTTTCATLVDAGWHYCADDHAILHPTAAGLVVEGWPRPFHLDRGWDDGAPIGGPRRDVDAFTRWPGRWRPAAPLGGVLFPRVEADAVTTLDPLDAPTRLAALLRQSPWLAADPAAASALLALLRRAAARPGAALRLGRDTFRRPAPLAAALAPLTARA